MTIYGHWMADEAAGFRAGLLAVGLRLRADPAGDIDSAVARVADAKGLEVEAFRRYVALNMPVVVATAHPRAGPSRAGQGRKR